MSTRGRLFKRLQRRVLPSHSVQISWLWAKDTIQCETSPTLPSPVLQGGFLSYLV